MRDVDLTRVLPTGELGWATLLEYVRETDDRIERYFLEVKSDVDLSTKRGRAKVAKFILGAANRDPQQAAGRFGGYAVMLLGVGDGRASGIRGFEAMELNRDVQKFIGADGPRWDFDRIPTDGEQDVIAIVVAPPTGQVWTCRADGEGLINGEIYVRADGETRKAKGDEVRAMIERATTLRHPAFSIGVELLGCVNAIRVDTRTLLEAIEQKGEALLDQLCDHSEDLRFSDPYPYLGGRIIDFHKLPDIRTKEEFRVEVDTWLRRARDCPAAGVLESMGRERQGLRIRVLNRTRTFLRDVRIDFEFGGNVTATAWREPNFGSPIDLFPGIPQAWGNKLLDYHFPRYATYARSRHGIIEIKQDTPARLSLVMDTLRPEEDFTTGDDYVVLVLVTDEAPDDPLSCHWRLTAEGVNDVHEGKFGVIATFTDLRDRIEGILRPKLG